MNLQVRWSRLSPKPGESIDFLLRLAARGQSPYLFLNFAPSLATWINPSEKASNLNLTCPRCHSPGRDQFLYLDHLAGGIRCANSQCDYVSSVVNDLPRFSGLSRHDLAIRAQTYIQGQGDLGVTELSAGAILRDDAFHGLVGEIVLALDQFTEADPVAVLMHLLTYFGACVGSNPHFIVSGVKHPPRLFTIIVGRTASARKGTADGFPRDLFNRVDPDFIKNRRKGGLSTGSGLIRAAFDVATSSGGAASKDRRMLIVESEFGLVLRGCDKITCSF